VHVAAAIRQLLTGLEKTSRIPSVHHGKLVRNALCDCGLLIAEGYQGKARARLGLSNSNDIDLQLPRSTSAAEAQQ